MRLSTRTRYGSRAMVELAWAYPERAVSVRQIADSQKLSPKYLEQIMAPLKTGGLVESTRGIHGGYALTRDPTAISMLEIYGLLEETSCLVDCVEDPKVCDSSSSCSTRQLWADVADAIASVLGSTTLADLAGRTQPREPCPEDAEGAGTCT